MKPPRTTAAHSTRPRAAGADESDYGRVGVAVPDTDALRERPIDVSGCACGGLRPLR
jgi:hypothetical protein